jgi:hypothetical protein
MLGSESNNDVAMKDCGRVGARNEAAIWCTPKRVEDALNVSRRVFDRARYNLAKRLLPVLRSKNNRKENY